MTKLRQRARTWRKWGCVASGRLFVWDTRFDATTDDAGEPFPVLITEQLPPARRGGRGKK